MTSRGTTFILTEVLMDQLNVYRGTDRRESLCIFGIRIRRVS